MVFEGLDMVNRVSSGKQGTVIGCGIPGACAFSALVCHSTQLSPTWACPSRPAQLIDAILFLDIRSIILSMLKRIR